MLCSKRRQTQLGFILSAALALSLLAPGCSAGGPARAPIVSGTIETDEVRVYVPEPWLGHIQLGEIVTVRVDSHPGKDFSGVVEQIARAAEFTPRNVQTVGERIKQVFGIKVRLAQREGNLRADMAADVTFPKVARQ